MRSADRSRPRGSKPAVPGRGVRRVPAAATVFGLEAGTVLPGPSELRRVAAPLLALPNVLGWFLGPKWTDGERLDQLALCFIVAEKLPRRRLSASERLPPRLRCRVTSRELVTVVTDVHAAGAPSGDPAAPGAFARATTYFGPGDAVVGPPPGTVGFALDHPAYGPVLVTAGHVFEGTVGVWDYRPPRPVRLRNSGPEPRSIAGLLVRTVITDRADYALVKPAADVPCQNVYQDTVVLGRPYSASPSDPAQPLYVLKQAGATPTELRGLEAVVPVGALGWLHDAILTDRCTVGGDSGAALVDAAKRVWGTLVGFSGRFSVFMRPQMPIYYEHADYR